jgi:glycosyltransferase involved in cell wall biosynthesis
MFDFDSTPVQLGQLDGYEPPVDAKPIAAVKYRLMRRLFESVALNQAWSRWARDSVISDYGIDPSRVVINPPGVDLEFWAPTARQPRGADQPARVVFVGGDFERKGGPDLLDWFDSIEPGRVELDIVTRDPVKPRPGVNVIHGIGPNSVELRQLLGHADVFVLPSRGECFGIATVEAMASGAPVVVTDVGGTADIVVPGENGYIVPPRRPRELGAAIETIISDESTAARMRRRSREIAESRFDLRANTELTLARLKRLASQSHDESRVGGSSRPAAGEG